MPRPIPLQFLILLLIACGLSQSFAADKQPPAQSPAAQTPPAEKPFYSLNSQSPMDEVLEALKCSDYQQRLRGISVVGRRAAEAQGKGAVLPLMRAISDSRTRCEALRALKNFGPDAAPAIPAIYKSLTAYPDDPSSRGAAADALASIGAAAHPLLVQGAASDNQYERLWCQAALAKKEGPKSARLELLSKAMLSSDKATSELGVDCLKMIGPGAVSTLPQVIAAVDNPAASKLKLVFLLLEFRKQATPAIPQLAKLLDDPDESISYWAAHTLAEIGGPELKPAISGLTRMLSREQTYFHEIATQALGRAGPVAAPAVKPLINCLLKDSSEKCRAAAAYALSRIAPADAAVVTALCQAMQDQSGVVLGEVAPILAKHAPLTPEVKQVFTKAATSPFWRVQSAYVDFLSRLDPAEREKLPKPRTEGINGIIR